MKLFHHQKQQSENSFNKDIISPGKSIELKLNHKKNQYHHSTSLTMLPLVNDHHNTLKYYKKEKVDFNEYIIKSNYFKPKEQSPINHNQSNPKTQVSDNETEKESTSQIQSKEKQTILPFNDHQNKRKINILQKVNYNENLKRESIDEDKMITDNILRYQLNFDKPVVTINEGTKRQKEIDNTIYNIPYHFEHPGIRFYKKNNGSGSLDDNVIRFHNKIYSINTKGKDPLVTNVSQTTQTENNIHKEQLEKRIKKNHLNKSISNQTIQPINTSKNISLLPYMKNIFKEIPTNSSENRRNCNREIIPKQNHIIRKKLIIKKNDPTLLNLTVKKYNISGNNVNENKLQLIIRLEHLNEWKKHEEIWLKVSHHSVLIKDYQANLLPPNAKDALSSIFYHSVVKSKKINKNQYNAILLSITTNSFIYYIDSQHIKNPYNEILLWDEAYKILLERWHPDQLQLFFLINKLSSDIQQKIKKEAKNILEKARLFYKDIMNLLDELFRKRSIKND